MAGAVSATAQGRSGRGRILFAYRDRDHRQRGGRGGVDRRARSVSGRPRLFPGRRHHRARGLDPRGVSQGREVAGRANCDAADSRARASELEQQVAVAADQFKVWEEFLGVRTLKAQPWSEFSRHLNLIEGNAVTFTDHAGQWLRDPENEKVPESWVAVFEAYSTAMYLRSRVYFSQYASWVRYREAKLAELQGRTDDAATKELEDLGKNDDDAFAAMKTYFEDVRSTFRNLHWLGRRMAPIWHKGMHNNILESGISFTAGDRDGATEDDRTHETEWKMLNTQWEEFAVLLRNEKVEGGAVVWGWNPKTNRIIGPLTGGSLSMGSTISPSRAWTSRSSAIPSLPRGHRLLPDATPMPWDGIHVLLALEKETNALHLKYFVRIPVIMNTGIAPS